MCCPEGSSFGIKVLLQSASCTSGCRAGQHSGLDFSSHFPAMAGFHVAYAHYKTTELFIEKGDIICEQQVYVILRFLPLFYIGFVCVSTRYQAQYEQKSWLNPCFPRA